ncbi:VRR-NUC domain-containing protein [Glutamicibacter sp. PS]|uniref:VRR-NUC domain-containing protein n=1 Tax=Glutamicibacter sp. PS TaxID=3075634 RepID=UPI00283D12DE|nr:VRR-NUC domain-containing protein [Glutamicibacter sp. PS]MDR4533224.1 VRR-NUC domain-containing protein [Glutamicibacter sp. PS]
MKVRHPVLDWTEEAFQNEVISAAKGLGFTKIYHTHDSRRSPAGFPDLVLVHPRRGVIFAELKSERGRVSDAQQAWLEDLRAAGQVAYVWRPMDWVTGRVQSALAGKEVARAGAR